MHQLTAAHPRLKFGTWVRVTNTVNQRTVLVRINDRGPFVAGRVIDLSLAAAEELQMVSRGLATVTLEVVAR
jgi:rare lipoprotein A